MVFYVVYDSIWRFLLYEESTTNCFNKTETINDIECYKMNNFFIRKDGIVVFYIDKETGLTMRIMEMASSIVDGIEKDFPK